MLKLIILIFFNSLLKPFIVSDIFSNYNWIYIIWKTYLTKSNILPIKFFIYHNLTLDFYPSQFDS